MSDIEIEKSEIEDISVDDSVEESKDELIVEEQSRDSLESGVDDDVDSFEFEGEVVEDEIELFEMLPLNYEPSSFDIELSEVHRCRDEINRYGYSIILHRDDVYSKYFVKLLHQSIDKYVKKRRVELKFNLSNSNEYKIDFNDLVEYISSVDEPMLAVVDLYKLQHVDKEFFINSLVRYMKKGDNRVKFRELLLKKEIQISLIVDESDLSRDDNLQIFSVEDSKTEDRKKEDSGTTLDEYISVVVEDALKSKVLLVATIFKGVGAKELHSLLLYILEEEELDVWKRERKAILKELGLQNRLSSNGSSLIFEKFSLEEADTILEAILGDDPFILSELFNAIESDEKFIDEVLLATKSKAVVNGFFTLLKYLSLDEPSLLSIEWFEDKFIQDIPKENSSYYFSLGACAITVAQSQNDYSFIDSLLKRFRKYDNLKALFFLVEYFSYLDDFDTLEWYRVILSSIDSDSKLRLMIYRSISKMIYDDSSVLSQVALWSNSSSGYLMKNGFYILMRFASDALKSNRWDNKSEVEIPIYLLDTAESQRFIEAIYESINREDSLDRDSYMGILNENINKLFFIKIVGMISREDGGANYKRTLKAIRADISELFRGSSKRYISLILLLILEWRFVTKSSKSDVVTLDFMEVLNSIFDREDKRELRGATIKLSTILLKLASNSRRDRELSSRYMLLRELLKNLQLEIKIR